MAGRNEVSFDVVARDKASRMLEKVGRSLGKTGKAADGMGDEMEGAALDAGKLNLALAATEEQLRDIAREFDRTGDRGLFKDRGKVQRDLNQLKQFQKLLGDVGDGGDGKRGFGGVVKQAVADLGALGPYAKGGLVAAAIAAAPLIGGAVGGAVLGGVGTGGIIGGVALAATDSRVQEAGKEIGRNLLGQLQQAGEPFVEPVLVSLRMLESTGSKAIFGLRQDFLGLAPTLVPLTRGIDGMIENLGPGFSKAFTAAKPVIRLLGKELPEIGDAISYMLTEISDNSDGAVMALNAVLDVTEWLVRRTGDLVGFLSNVFEKETRGVAFWSGILEDLPWVVGPAAAGFAALNNEAESLVDGLDDAKDSSGDFAGEQDKLATATERALDAMRRQHDELLAQTDPMFALVDAVSDLRDKQVAYNEAVAEHGKNSQEAKDASLALAQAALALQGAAGDAAGTFDGSLDPALRDVLTTAGLTEQQIRDVETAFGAAKNAGDKFAKNYTASVLIKYQDQFGGFGRGAFEGLGARAGGGPVEANRPYLVGEDGPEIVVPDGSGTVLDANKTKSLMSGGAGYGAISAPTGSDGGHPVIELRLSGADRSFLSWLQGALKDNPGVVVTIA